MKKLLITLGCVGSLFGYIPVAHGFHVDIDPELKKEYDCMVLNLHHEARGEGMSGMIAVANVVLNRVKHKKFLNSVCEVVYQKYQFSWVRDKRVRHIKPEDANDKAKIVAYEAIVSRSLKDKTNGALYFKKKTAVFTWVDPEDPPIVKTVSIGKHEFFKYKTKKSRNN